MSIVTKKKIFEFINHNLSFQKFLYSLIVINVLALFLESYKGIYGQFADVFSIFEVCSVIIFSIEYLLRLWVADLGYEQGSSFARRLKFIFSTVGIIDLFAILPFYLPLFFAFDLRILRILRLFRLLRIFKLGRLSRSIQTITNVIKDTKSELQLRCFCHLF